MAIEEFKCHEFRNLKNTTLSFNKQLNLIIGDNGSGKSSLLEAIYILSTSKSFRTNHLKSAIKHDFSEFILFSKYSNHSVGLKKSTDSLVTKVDNKSISKSSLLAKKQAILAIDPSSFNLINGSPKSKRSFIDWALFHVKHKFSECWNNYRNILKQRNLLLKTKQVKELHYWDQYLVEYNDKIHQLRLDIVAEFLVNFKDLIKNNALLSQVDIKYKQGWNKEKSFKEALSSNQANDIKRGFTSVGSHKCDLHFSINGKDIKEVLSRGQMKDLLIFLHLTILDLVSQKLSTKPIFIIDDLASELDKNTFKSVIVSLLEKDYQIFISSIEYDDFFKKLDFNKTVFHVKHGEINRMTEKG